MASKRRALDKIYKRRDRYEIPDWQREEVWDLAKKQSLIDSVLRGWKLPKFYFVKTSEDPEEFEDVDGQQRLSAIFEFFDDELSLSSASAKFFKGQSYKSLPSAASDAFDDFEIEYDEITDANEQELKTFFQRLQQGLPLTGSEKLNSVHSDLRNFCKELARHSFFENGVAFSNKRYAFFDVVAKAAAIEIEGLSTGLRFDDLRELFTNQASFSSKSAAAKRLKKTLDFLSLAFPKKTSVLRNRSIVQSMITLATKVVETGHSAGKEKEFCKFIDHFMADLLKEVELGLSATDADYVTFQRSVNANRKEGAKIRHQIMLRKLFRMNPSLGSLFEPEVVAEAGVQKEIRKAAEVVGDLVEQINTAYSSKHGRDLFKATNKTVAAQRRIQKPIRNISDYKNFIESLYFLFWEGTGQRLSSSQPQSFKDINELRTDLQHDVDHGKDKRVVSKRKKMSAVFQKYGASTTPNTIAPEQFVIVHLNLLATIEADLRQMSSVY